MKILHICTSLNIGGTETMLVDIINEQVKTNTVNLIIINKGINKDVYKKIDNQVCVNCLKRTPGSRNILHFISFNYLIAKINPDIIHCHGSEIIKYIFIKRKAKICITVHDIGYPLGSLKKYNHIFAISKAVQNDLDERLNIKATVIYNGIHTERVKMKNNYNYDIFKIVCVARLMHQKKGQDILIKAISILVNKENIKNISVDFIGEGKSEKYLKDLVNELKVGQFVKFIGLKNRDYIYSHLKDYELLVQPSIYEGFGLTVIEGMAAKVPVLVSNIQGPMEVIGNGTYGYAFKINDEVDCARKIIDVIEDYNKNIIQDKCEKAYFYVKENFDVKKTAANYVSEYKKL